MTLPYWLGWVSFTLGVLGIALAPLNAAKATKTAYGLAWYLAYSWIFGLVNIAVFWSALHGASIFR